MISKKQIESILKINGVNPASPDEEIRSVLLSARYKEDEVDTALMVLRENTKTKKTRVEGLHKVFRTEETLNSEEISQLLGIDVDIPVARQQPAVNQRQTNLQFITIILLSIIITILGTILYMYINQMGLFHQSFAVR
jgi:hypothetical protein